jgi:hypothetical protein
VHQDRALTVSASRDESARWLEMPGDVHRVRVRDPDIQVGKFGRERVRYLRCGVYNVSYIVLSEAVHVSSTPLAAKE